MRGVEGHSGQSKGDHSANKPGSSLCSSPFVRHGSATRGGGPCLLQQHLLPAFICVV